MALSAISVRRINYEIDTFYANYRDFAVKQNQKRLPIWGPAANELLPMRPIQKESAHP
jgi:hypothetical protein